MSPLRMLIVIAVFVVLVALELIGGFWRLAALSERREGEIIEAVRREHVDGVGRLQAFVDRARRELDYVAGLTETHERLEGLVGSHDRGLAAFVGAFPELDRLTLLDAAGRPVAEYGSHTPADDAPARPWLQADVVCDDGPMGVVRARLAWGPLETALRDSHALAGVVDRIVVAADPPAADHALGDAAPVRDDHGLTYRSRLDDALGLGLETRLPQATLDAAMHPLSQEYAWIVGSMVVFTAAVLGLGVFVLRLGRRAFRLHETEHYLRWIRRVTDRYRALMEGAADMILIVEGEGGRVREANAAAREALELPAMRPAGVPGSAPGPSDDDAPPLVELVTGEARERLGEALADVSRQGGRTVLAGIRIQLPSGRGVDVDASLARIDLGEESVVQVSLRDVTRQREVERQLQTAERISSLGLLTAGVAHEINNPLEGIGNYLALAERARDDEARARQLGQVRRGLDRIRDIVQDLLSFARPAAASGHADLVAVVDAAVGMAAYTSEVRGLEISRTGLDAPLRVPGDAGRLEQVVLNLVLNAARAMQGRGTLELSARRVTDEQGAWVEFASCDDGPGIPPDDLRRLFDPFFSRHEGTGLGLAVSFGIASAHGGTLTAHNRAEGGACFVLRLPAHAEGESS